MVLDYPMPFRIEFFHLLYVCALGVSVDCPNVNQLAMGMNLHVLLPNFMKQMSVDCCNSTGNPSDTNTLLVVCDSTKQRVLEINWFSLGLNGTINYTAIPSALTVFKLYNNVLNGLFPDILPSGLTYLDFSNNRLTGSIPNSLPLTLTRLDVFTNSLTGSIPRPLPSTLDYLNFGYNSLTGTIPSVLPIGLTYFRILYNQISGTIPRILPSGLTYMGFTSNKLTGTIPSILPSNLQLLILRGNLLTGDLPSFPPSIQYLYLNSPGVSGNYFTGTLRLNAPYELLMVDNWISDVTINDISHLTNCDLSNNPLFGNPHIVNLTMCTQNNLYNLSALPITVTKHSITSSTTETAKTSFTLPSSTKSKISNNLSALSIYSTFYTITSTSLDSSTTETSFTLSNSTSIIYLQTNNPDSVEAQLDATNPYLLYGAFALLALLCILVVVASILVKRPQMKSKFARKSSYGTLNTVNTTMTTRTK